MDGGQVLVNTICNIRKAEESLCENTERLTTLALRSYESRDIDRVISLIPKEAWLELLDKLFRGDIL
jgi:hypothetical protein